MMFFDSRINSIVITCFSRLMTDTNRHRSIPRPRDASAHREFASIADTIHLLRPSQARAKFSPVRDAVALDCRLGTLDHRWFEGGNRWSANTFQPETIDFCQIDRYFVTLWRGIKRRSAVRALGWRS